jgi:hypothetical protein
LAEVEAIYGLHHPASKKTAPPEFQESKRKVVTDKVFEKLDANKDGECSSVPGTTSTDMASYTSESGRVDIGSRVPGWWHRGELLVWQAEATRLMFASPLGSTLLHVIQEPWSYVLDIAVAADMKQDNR